MKFYVLFAESVYVFCTDHSTGGDYLAKDTKFIEYYKRDGVRLLRGRQWIFKFSSGQSYSVKSTADVEKI
jgi:hypothetical protein